MSLSIPSILYLQFWSVRGSLSSGLAGELACPATSLLRVWPSYHHTANPTALAASHADQMRNEHPSEDRPRPGNWSQKGRQGSEAPWLEACSRDLSLGQPHSAKEKQGRCVSKGEVKPTEEKKSSLVPPHTCGLQDQMQFPAVFKNS